MGSSRFALCVVAVAAATRSPARAQSSPGCSDQVAGLSARLNDVCCDGGAQRGCAHGIPTECSPACARLWRDFTANCPAVAASLSSFRPFAAQCEQTALSAVVLSARGVGTPTHQQFTYDLAAEGGNVYEVTLTADSQQGSHQNELYIYAPDHTTLLAYDTELGASKTITWTCTSTARSYVLEVWTLSTVGGREGFTVTTTLVGTAADNALRAVVDRTTPLTVDCAVGPGGDERPSCRYSYDGAETKGDGTSFVLKLDAEVGRRYHFELTSATGALAPATHITATIFPPGSAGGSESWRTGDWETTSWFEFDVGGLPWTSTQTVTFAENAGCTAACQDSQSGCQSWARTGECDNNPSWMETHCSHSCSSCWSDEECRALTPGSSFRYFPGLETPPAHAFNWTAPVSSIFLMEIALNCDIPYYSSISTDAQDKRCAAAFDMTITAETRETVTRDTTILARDQEACVLEAGTACQASFISHYERQQHAYLMYVTSVSAQGRAATGDLVDVAVAVRVQATDEEDGASALKSLTSRGIGCGHRRLDAEVATAEYQMETAQAARISELEREVARLAEELRMCTQRHGASQR